MIERLDEENINRIMYAQKEEEQAEIIEKWEEILETLKENENDELMKRTSWVD